LPKRLERSPNKPASLCRDRFAYHELSPSISSKNGVESITCEGMDMKPNRFTDEQIIGILREQEPGY